MNPLIINRSFQISHNVMNYGRSDYKNENMSLTENQENWEEFIVCCEKVGFIDSVKGKIERLFGTRVYFDEVSRDGDKEKRWVRVTGGKWDRQNAKTYILGISDPEETKSVKCSADFLDNEILEDIEKNTQAVLEKCFPNIKISGSELAVTLALSALEELTGCVDEGSSPSERETNERSASRRLDEKLDETFGEGRSSYHSYPSSIKRVLLECGTRLDEDGQDVQEELLHGSGIDAGDIYRQTVSEVLIRKKEEPEPRRNVTAPVCRNDGGVGKLSNAEIVSGRERSSEVSTVTEQFPLAAQISPDRARSGQDEDYLRHFARNVGYTDEEVAEGFLYVAPPMKPTDFLNILKTVKESKQKLGLSEVAEEASSTQGVKNESVYVVSDGEEEIMIVDDHFKKTEVRKPLSPKSLRGGLSNKQKKNNEQKQSDLAKQFEQQQNKSKPKKQTSPKNASSSDSVDSSSGQKKQGSAREGNPSGTKRKSDPDSDSHEQTCVMKIWEPNPDMTSRDPRHNQPRHQRMVESKDEATSAAKPQTRRTPMMQQQQPPAHMMHKPQAQVKPQPVEPCVRMPVYPNPVSHFNGSPVHRQQQQQQQQQPCQPKTDNLRYVIIDGSNVAMTHGNHKVFSCKGIQIAVDFFLDRGHKVTVFIPEWRKYKNYAGNRIRDQELLTQLEDARHLVFTPSRRIQGKLFSCYDDRFILSLAEKEDSVILSNDQYRDLMNEKASLRKIVEERLLMYRFVGDHFMPAEDPLGRNGPMLDEFLQKHPAPAPAPAPPLPQRAPYHPQHHNARAMVQPHRYPIGHWHADGVAQGHVQGQGQVHQRGQGQQPLQIRGGQPQQRFQQPEKPKRHSDVTEQLLSQLKNVFSEPWQEEKIKKVLENHSSETDLNRLTNYCMEVIFP